MSDGVRVVIFLAIVLAGGAIVVLAMVPEATTILKETLARIGFGLLLLVIGTFLVVVSIVIREKGFWALIPGALGLAFWLVSIKFFRDSWQALTPLWESIK